MDRLAKARDLCDAALGADAPPACSSCGSAIDGVPKARGECDPCGQQIVVRRIAGQTRPITPEQVEVLKTQEATLRERRKYLLRGGSWQVDEAARDATAETLTRQLGAEAAMGLTHWRLANEATVRYQTEHDWARAGQVYTDMAGFLVEVGRIGSTSRREERSAHDSATTPVLRWLQTRVTSCSVSPLQRGATSPRGESSILAAARSGF
ncbi:hypothetical protein [Rathayibacter sp. Leaf248]|uniref:hypothetical protein n=1 Tax=Rathayibacter sp. Leaf248 TaxID=2876555 RepID=UPI001E3EF59C|nr:hypothetical protein [Rathayibacter sp. Leaf248]